MKEPKKVDGNSFWTKFSLYGLSNRWDAESIPKITETSRLNLNELTTCDLFWGFVWGGFKAMCYGVALLFLLLVCALILGFIEIVLFVFAARYISWKNITEISPCQELGSTPIKFLRIRSIPLCPIFFSMPALGFWIWQDEQWRQFASGIFNLVLLMVLGVAAVIGVCLALWGIYEGCSKLYEKAKPILAAIKEKSCRKVEITFPQQAEKLTE